MGYGRNLRDISNTVYHFDGGGKFGGPQKPRPNNASQMAAILAIPENMTGTRGMQKDIPQEDVPPVQGNPNIPSAV